LILWDQRCEVEKNKKQSYFTHSLFFLILGKMDNPPFHFTNAKIYSSVFGLMFSFYLNHYAKRFHFSDDFNWNAIRYMQAVADEIVLPNVDPQNVLCWVLILKLVSWNISFWCHDSYQNHMFLSASEDMESCQASGWVCRSRGEATGW